MWWMHGCVFLGGGLRRRNHAALLVHCLPFVRACVFTSLCLFFPFRPSDVHKAHGAGEERQPITPETSFARFIF